ncbi:MAG: serine/threonine-protein kinase [Deltaproteobacteria bacterium]
MYLLLEEVGSGSSGTAHLAVRSDERTDELFVVKQLRPAVAAVPEHLSRFKHEAAIAVMVDHPNVVDVVDVGLAAERPYIVMRYVEGPTVTMLLNALARSKSRLSVEAAVGLVREALAGIEALHTARHPRTGEPLGFVHRDLAPKNLIVTRDGRVKLIDLGLGRSRLGEWQTEAGRIMGSIGYMPPEQLRGEAVDQRADLWSLACVLFELITLTPYVPGRGRERLLATLKTEPRSMREVRPDVPVALDEVVLRALSNTPAARFESASALSRALEQTCAAPSPNEIALHVEGEFGEALDERRHRLRETALTIVEPLEITEHYERIASRPGEDVPMFGTYDATKVIAAPTRVDRPPSAPPPPARRKGPEYRWGELAAITVVVAMIVAGGVYFGLRPAQEPVAPAVAPAPEPNVAPAAVATPSAQPREVDVAPNAVAETTPPKPRRDRPKKTRPRTPRVDKKVPVVREEPVIAPRARAARLMKRLQGMRADDVAGAEALIMELTALDLVQDPERYSERLGQLERRTKALAP